MRKILRIDKAAIRYDLDVRSLFSYEYTSKFPWFGVDNDMIMDDYLQRFFSAV
jgi:hypothetical protein